MVLEVEVRVLVVLVVIPFVVPVVGPLELSQVRLELIDSLCSPSGTQVESLMVVSLRVLRDEVMCSSSLRRIAVV